MEAQQGWDFELVADVLASHFTEKTELARQKRPQTLATKYTGLSVYSCLLQILPPAASGNSSSAHLLQPASAIPPPQLKGFSEAPLCLWAVSHSSSLLLGAAPS